MSKNLNSQEIKRENPIGNREANRLTGIEKALHLLSNTMAMIAHSVLSWSVSPSPLNKDQGWRCTKECSDNSWYLTEVWAESQKPCSSCVKV